jgi:hypothetical protein
MTRSKELKRIEDAIRYKGKAELEWAISYCAARLKIGGLSRNQKRWRDLQKEIAAALQNAK